MTEAREKKPMYEDRVKEIIRGLVEGKSRDTLAKEIGYKNYKTLDIYMRRKNFRWDAVKQNYVPSHDPSAKLDADFTLHSSTKISTIIALFNKADADAKTIAKHVGFANHRELANYMKAKGYHWSSALGNYQKALGRMPEPQTPEHTRAEDEAQMHITGAPDAPATASKAVPKGDWQVERYMPLLDMLERNKDRLVDLIVAREESAQIPRYGVPGVFVTKSVHMTNTLDQLVREYSKEKNISQRDIFAVALIEFFKRYGYEREINTLLGKM